MYKKLACFMTETNFEEMEKTSMLKKLTGQDLIGYEFKQKALIDDLNYAKILIATNNLPPTTDKTIGFYRRWMIIDFLNKFKEGIDPIILIPNIEFENLAKKSIEMLKELLKEGIFNNEGEIEERMKRYEDRSNPFDKFWKENVVEDSERFIGKTEFKNRLEEWCKENKFRIISERTITKKMEELKIFEGFEDYYIDLGNGDRERKKYRIWRGINWKSGTDATLGTHNPTSPISREKQVGLQVPAVPNVPFSSIFDDKVRFNEEEQEIVEEKVK
jgi:putative DNA primase/helicase